MGNDISFEDVIETAVEGAVEGLKGVVGAVTDYAADLDQQREGLASTGQAYNDTVYDQGGGKKKRKKKYKRKMKKTKNKYKINIK